MIWKSFAEKMESLFHTFQKSGCDGFVTVTTSLETHPILCHTTFVHHGTPMNFKINQIQFDFTDDLYEECLDLESQDEIYDEVLNTIWEVNDEEELVDTISDKMSWCVLSIDYQEV